MSRFPLILLILAVFTHPVLADGKRPNIIFIFSDDHATKAISAYGDSPLQTPGIDRIANEGMIFSASYCGNSICGPSRASILTGVHSHRNGFLDNASNPNFDGAQTTFPKLLQQAGYQTALVGKWHLGSNPTGFDQWEILPGQGNYYNPDFIQMDGSVKRFQGYSTAIITDKALEWLDHGRDKSKPFLLMVQHKAPHRSFAPSLEDLKLFDGKEIPEPDTLFDDYSNRSSLLKEHEMGIDKNLAWNYDLKVRGGFNPDNSEEYGDPEYDRMTPEQRKVWDAHFEPINRKFINDFNAGKIDDKARVRWKFQRYMKNYLSCIKAVDDSVQAILKRVDDAGLTDNTIVIYSSDQGFYLGEHGWYDKRWMFEESFKMPFVIRWPGHIKPGSRSGALIQNIDYAPTFLTAAGLPVPGRMQGKPLEPLFADPAAKVRDALFYTYYETTTHHVPMHSGVFDGRIKLIHFPKTNEWNLFDLKTDPQELKSVATDPERAETLERMRKLYQEQAREYAWNRSTIPESRGSGKENPWMDRHKTILKRANTNPSQCQLVFVGDSITEGWEGPGKEVWNKHFSKFQPLNLGISGDRTEHVLWRIKNGEWPAALQPKVAVVMIGTNNTGFEQGQPAGETAAGIQLIVEDILDRSPGTRIILHPVFPRGATAKDPKRLVNDRINALIGKLGNHPNVSILDISGRFLDAEGNLSKSLMPDSLHPNTAGYEIWGSELEGKLTELGLSAER